MASSANTPEFVDYFSKRWYDVAQLNTVLETFNSVKPLPAESKRTIQFVRYDKLLEKYMDTMGCKSPYSTYAFGRNDWDLGGFDFEGPSSGPVLETRPMTARDREELGRLLF